MASTSIDKVDSVGAIIFKIKTIKSSKKRGCHWKSRNQASASG